MSTLKPSRPVRHPSLFRAAACALAATATFAAASTEALANKVSPNAIRNHGLFGITVAGTAQEFYGKADLVLSVSMQEYTTGALIVNEVVIDMMGSNQVLRLYATRPVGTQDAARAARAATDASSELTNGAIVPTLPDIPSEVSRADDAAARVHARTAASLVFKAYPTTTHAKTVEFAVGSQAELAAFYKTFRDLYASRDVRVSGGKVVAPNAGNSTPGAATATVISKLGGVLFTIE